MENTSSNTEVIDIEFKKVLSNSIVIQSLLTLKHKKFIISDTFQSNIHEFKKEGNKILFKEELENVL